MEGSAKAKREEAEKEGQQVQLPTESSPYVKYEDLEDYKMQGYGAQGQQPVVDKSGGGGTDAPTISGSGLSESQAHAFDAVDRQRVP
ncbi:hypothetical protein OPV22_013350 [Ensete ventricosum]|uniref:Uncharacterized protein n=1 Tax=Ensete ventricosum TaxID=4639 RepID=A0AAV8PMY3_ENSVE|nr:hypothetical protein OPV22_013350 [Ensete ventricosum]RWW11949.1 hypothetical protein GW17_00024413 [Ensete ventricosum]RZS21613.1 hypothetical protein BHM03_00054273 [Ensete ventricosum]